MPQENCTTAKTITDFTFALIKAIPIIIMIACINSSEKQYSSPGVTVGFTSGIFLETAPIKKENFSLLKRGLHGELKKLRKEKSLTEGFHIKFVQGKWLTRHLNISKFF